MNKKIVAVAFAAGLVVPLAACSGGTSSSGNSSAPVTSSASASASASEGGNPVNPGASLPAGWPSDIPAPEGFTIVTATNHTTAGRASLSVTYQGNGDVATVNDALSAELVKNGYTRTSFIDGAAKVTNWTKGTARVGMTVAQNANKATTVVLTYTPGK